MYEKYKDIFEEIEDEINKSLEDSKGISIHQRRLSFLLSLGLVNLIEIYLIKKNVFKQGSKINHLWLKKKKDNVKKFIANQITCPIGKLKELDNILDETYKIEKDRNLLAYGKRVSEKILKEKIDIFLNLKKEVLEND